MEQRKVGIVTDDCVVIFADVDRPQLPWQPAVFMYVHYSASQWVYDNIVSCNFLSVETLIYACLAPFFGGSPVSVEVTTVGDQTTYQPTADPAFLISAMVLAILFALVVGASITHDFHMKILRRMRLTYKTARDSTWIDIFIDQRRYVEVAFTDGRRLFGWPLYYSNQPEEGLLYLYDAAWIDAEGKYVDLDAHGILLTKKEDIESIVFTNLEFGQAGPRGEGRQVGNNRTR